MSRGYRLLLTVVCVGALGMCGGCVGLVAGWGRFWPYPSRTETCPLPHQIPKYPDGISLRFAMVHDVVHERFPRHGTAYYRERNRRVRQALDVLAAQPRPAGQSPEYFELLDDLAVGLEFVGEHDEAIHLMRDKLRQQQTLGLQGRNLYSTYANLGTFLILGPFRQVRPGNDADKAVLREGLGYIHESIKVNPEAHFGREVWQAVIVEFMIALLDNPQLLLKYDMIGDRLDSQIDPLQMHALQAASWVFEGEEQRVAKYLQDPGNQQEASLLRRSITQVGAEVGWKNAVKTSHQASVPFDEPVLGIVGMWRLGGGAHPHFALALGESMLRVGQRYLAWCAFERAARLAEMVWPDPQLQQQFVEHCRQRQAMIERQLSEEERAKLRPAFEAELAMGQRYQQAYQGYEEQQIAAGVSLDDPHFYDAFHAEREPIASPIGDQDYVTVTVRPRNDIPTVPLFAGVVAFGGVCLWRFLAYLFRR